MERRTMSKEQMARLFYIEKEHIVTAFNLLLGNFGDSKSCNKAGFDNDISKAEQLYTELGQNIKLLKMIRDKYVLAPDSEWTYENRD